MATEIEIKLAVPPREVLDQILQDPQVTDYLRDELTKKQMRSTYYDTIVDISRFIIIDDAAVNSGFIWNESIWGEFRLKPLEML